VTVQVSEADAEIDADGVATGTSPLRRPLVVDIGEHTIRARKPGFRGGVLTTVVGGRQDPALRLTLERDMHQGTLAVRAPVDSRLDLTCAAAKSPSTTSVRPAS
jgi:hypothetical protein